MSKGLKKNLLPGASVILLFVIYLNLRVDFIRTIIDWVVIIGAVIFFIFALTKWIFDRKGKNKGDK